MRMHNLASMHTLAGPSKSQQEVDSEQLAVKGVQAFQSPEMLTNFIGFLRAHVRTWWHGGAGLG